MNWEIKHGDWIEKLKEMPAESVHTVVTSPPYWGLRDYGAAGQLGLEKTPEEYISKMVAGFREVRRVLRKDGTLWLNMGDCYATGAGKVGNCPGGGEQGARWRGDVDRLRDDKRGYRGTRRAGKAAYLTDAMGPLIQPNRMPLEGLKPKDLVGMPWMLAFALRADGWYLRAQCPWIKRNSMPESVSDRPGTSTEAIFLLSKSPRYFYDAEAVKMPCAGTAHDRGNGVNPKAKMVSATSYIRQERVPRGRPPKQNESFSGAVCGLVSTRVRRNHDWFMDSWQGLLTGDEGEPLAFVVNPAGFPGAHFATFPPKLVEPCILAGTSEKGCCPKCGAPWERVLEKPFVGNWNPGPGSNGKLKVNAQRDDRKGAEYYAKAGEARTIDWLPTCDCWSEDPIPCTVLDPFAGAGTTGLVALRYHRNFIGIELKAEYVSMARRRITGDAPLFNTRKASTIQEELYDERGLSSNSKQP